MSINPVRKRPLEAPKLPDSKKEKFEPVSISEFPAEVIVNIFNFLSNRELGRMSRVCKTWREISNKPYFWQDFYDGLVRNKTYKRWKELQAAVVDSSEENRQICGEEWRQGPYQEEISDITALENELFSGTYAMGLAMTSFLKKDWEQIVTSDIKIPDEPQLDPYSTLSRMYQFQKIVQSSFTLMMIPEGFDFKKLDDESRYYHASPTSPGILNGGAYSAYFCIQTLRNYYSEFWKRNHSKDNIINDTMVVLIGHNILPGSANKTMEEQQKMLTELGCQMPSAIMIATLLFLHCKGNTTHHALGYTGDFTNTYQATRCTSSFNDYSFIFRECQRKGESVRLSIEYPDMITFPYSQFTIDVESQTKQDLHLGALPMMILYP